MYKLKKLNSINPKLLYSLNNYFLNSIWDMFNQINSTIIFIVKLHWTRMLFYISAFEPTGTVYIADDRQRRWNLYLHVHSDNDRQAIWWSSSAFNVNHGLGKISAQVYLISTNGCFVEYYSSSDLTGSYLGSQTESDISRNYGNGVVFGGLSDNVRWDFGFISRIFWEIK